MLALDGNLLEKAVDRDDRWVARQVCRRLASVLAGLDCRVRALGMLRSPGRCRYGLDRDVVVPGHLRRIACLLGRRAKLAPELAVEGPDHPHIYADPDDCLSTTDLEAWAGWQMDVHRCRHWVGRWITLELEPESLDRLIDGVPRTTCRVRLDHGRCPVRPPFPQSVLCGVVGLVPGPIRVQARHVCQRELTWIAGRTTRDPLPAIPIVCCAEVTLEVRGADEVELTYATVDVLPLYPIQSGPYVYRLPHARSVRCLGSNRGDNPFSAEDGGRQIVGF